jgi:hypothetical protein
LRLEDRKRLIWADAVCINQADDEEKSWQVRMMGDVYRNADRVLIWLGLAEDGSIPFYPRRPEHDAKDF